MTFLGGFRDVMKDDAREAALVSLNDKTPGESEPIEPREGSPEAAPQNETGATDTDTEEALPNSAAGIPTAVKPTAVKKDVAEKKQRGSAAKTEPTAPKKETARKTAQKRTSSKPAPAEDDDPAEPKARPHYSKLVRKELRLFQDQSVDLKIKSMEIHNAKYGVGERITDNTLVRIAVDLLLQRGDELEGTTEQELRESMGLPPRY